MQEEEEAKEEQKDIMGSCQESISLRSQEDFDDSPIEDDLATPLKQNAFTKSHKVGVYGGRGGPPQNSSD